MSFARHNLKPALNKIWLGDSTVRAAASSRQRAAVHAPPPL
jgi:hypothetical protein